MAARPISISRARQITITHVTRIDCAGGKTVRISHDPPQVRLVKVTPTDHNAAKSPAMTVDDQSGESAIETD